MSDYLDFIPIPPAIKTGTTSVTTDVPGNQVTLAANGTTRLEIDSTESTFTGNVQLGSGDLTTTGTINAGDVQLGSGPLNTSGTVTTGALRAGAGAVATPSITFGADTNTGFYRVNENILGLTAGGVQQFQIDTGTATFRNDVVIDGAGATIGGSNLGNSWLRIGSIANGIGLDDNEMFSSGSDFVIGTMGSGAYRVLFRPNATEVLAVDDTSIDMSVILDMNSNRITSLATPTSGSDAATKSYVDSNTGATGMGDGSASAPGWAFTSDTNTGFFRPSAEVIGFSASGTERMRVNTNGLEISSGQTLYNQSGSAASPSYRFVGDTNTGMFRAGEDIVGIATGGAERFRVSTGSTSVQSGFLNVATAGSSTSPAIQLGSTVGIFRAVNDLRNGINISVDDDEVVRIDNVGLRIDDTDTFGWISESDTLGMYRFNADVIGFKTSGSARLTVSDSLVTSLVRHRINEGGSASAPALYFESDSNTGVYHHSTDTLGISANGSTVATFNAINGLDMQGLPIANATFSATNFTSLTVADGTAGAPSIAFADDLDTGIFSQFTNRISFTAGGFERLRVDGNSGYVYPLAQMQSNYIGDDATKPNYSFLFDTNTGMFNPSADALGFSTGGVERGRFSSAGLTVTSGDLIVSSGAVEIPNGSETAPSLQFSADPDTGIYSPFAGAVAITSAGSRLGYFSNSFGGLDVDNDTFRIGHTTSSYVQFDGDNSGSSLVTTRWRIAGNNSFNNLVPRSYLYFSERRSSMEDIAYINAETLDTSPTTHDSRMTLGVIDYVSSSANFREVMRLEDNRCEIDGVLDVESSILFPQAYSSTTTDAPNVHIASSGLLRRSTNIPQGASFAATSDSTITVNNSTSPVQLGDSITMSVTNGDTFVLRAMIRGVQGSASAGVRIGVNVSSGSVTNSHVTWELRQYDALSSTTFHGNRRTTGGVSTILNSNAIMSTPSGSSDPFVITGDGYFTATNTGTFTIRLTVAQSSPVASNTQYQDGCFTLIKV